MSVFLYQIIKLVSSRYYLFIRLDLPDSNKNYLGCCQEYHQSVREFRTGESLVDVVVQIVKSLPISKTYETLKSLAKSFTFSRTSLYSHPGLS